MGRVELTRLDDAPVFRKIAMGSWRTVGDPSVYGQLDLDMEKALAFAEEYSKKHNVKVTPTHLVGRAIIHCFKKRPEINGMIRGTRIYLRKHIDLFFQVNVPGSGNDKIGKANLSGTTIRHTENMNLKEFVEELTRRASTARSGHDPNFSKTFKIFKSLPWWLVRFALNFTSFLNYGLNLNLSWAGIPKDPFGSVMITSVGGLGIDMAWAPLVPYSRVPILLTVGAVRKAPAVVNDEIVIRPIMSVAVTFDHRFIDGVHAAQMSQEFKKCFEEPEKYLA